MKKVASIAAPFASLIPGVGPFIGAGLGLLGSIGGNRNSQSSSGVNSMPGYQTMLATDMHNSIAKQAGMSDALIAQGKPMTETGAGYMMTSGDYLKKILGGGPEQEKALAGPISDLRVGSAAQLRNIAMGPRGNVAGQLADRGTALASQIARLRYGAQSEASDKLAGVGGLLGQQGNQLQLGGNSSYSNVVSSLLGLSGQQNAVNMQSAAIRNQNQQGLGEGIGSLLSVLLSPGGLLNKGKSGTTTTRPSTTPPWNPNAPPLWGT